MDGDAATAKIGKLIRALVFFGFDLCQRGGSGDILAVLFQPVQDAAQTFAG